MAGKEGRSWRAAGAARRATGGLGRPRGRKGHLPRSGTTEAIVPCALARRSPWGPCALPEIGPRDASTPSVAARAQGGLGEVRRPPGMCLLAEGSKDVWGMCWRRGSMPPSAPPRERLAAGVRRPHVNAGAPWPPRRVGGGVGRYHQRLVMGCVPAGDVFATEQADPTDMDGGAMVDLALRPMSARPGRVKSASTRHQEAGIRSGLDALEC